jgi:hypothetical protein
MERNSTIGGAVSRKILALAATMLAVVASLLLATFASAGGDRNRDRIPDRWEKQHRLSLKVDQSRYDQDSDGLNNKGEWRAKLDPRDDDSDDDGVEDGDENAGTVATFTDGVLTITLAKGGALVAKVTRDTEIACDDETAKAAGGDDGDDGDGDGDGNHDHGDRDHDDGDNENDDDDRGDDDSCGADPLTADRQVKEAELKVQNGEAVWEKVELGALER